MISDYLFIRFLYFLAQPPSHTPSQHQMSFDFSENRPLSVFTTYAQPSAFGLLIWYVVLPQPKVNKESESKSKNLMLSSELRMELSKNSFQPLKEDNKCSDQ